MLPGVEYAGCFQTGVATSSLSSQTGSSFNMTSCVVACLAASPMNYWFGLQNGQVDCVANFFSVLVIKWFCSGQCLCGRRGAFNLMSASLSQSGCNLTCGSTSPQICGGLSSITMYNNLLPFVPQPLFTMQNDSSPSNLFTGLSSTSPQSLLSSQINLIQNPYLSENAAIVCPQGALCVSGNNSGISPWYLTSGSVYEVDRTYFVNYDKSAFSMDLSAYVQYTIGQNISTVVGLPYIVTYMINVNKYCGERVKLGFVKATGAPQSNFSQHIQTWTAYNYTFIASSNNTVLEIGSIATSACGPILGCAFMHLRSQFYFDYLS
jgi:hypothetical protein